jgi:hypothetical protein
MRVLQVRLNSRGRIESQCWAGNAPGKEASYDFSQILRHVSVRGGIVRERKHGSCAGAGRGSHFNERQDRHRREKALIHNLPQLNSCGRFGYLCAPPAAHMRE